MLIGLVFLIFIPHSVSHCTGGRCEQTYLSLADIKHNNSLEGFIMRALSVTDWHSCFSKCMKNCQCLSYNFNEVNKTENCELNDANTRLAPEALKLKEGVSYHEPVRKYYNSDESRQSCFRPSCQSCCDSIPCQNGGTCQNVCDINNRRFNCTCPSGFAGYKCHVILPLRSCKDIMTKYNPKANGKFDIVDENNITFPVYCDFNSEPGMAWALIQSHSLSNTGLFKAKPFYDNIPYNQDSPELWKRYRLSMSRMKSIWSTSTHWRATCNYPTFGIDYRDYARASCQSLDLFVEPQVDAQCQTYEYINIRGITCVNCTAWTAYGGSYSLHIDSTPGSCEFDGSHNNGRNNEDNFGHYGVVNDKFRCTSGPYSTSQFWFGSL